MKYIPIFFACVSLLFSYNYHGCCLAPDNLHGWVACIDTAAILITTDGGATWQPQTVPPGTKRFFDITCRNETTAWTIGILGEILHTTNGGVDWIGQTIGLSKYGTRIEFIDDTLGWAVCGDGMVGRTTNAGGYWDQVFTQWVSAEYYGVSFVNAQTGWMVAGYPDSFLVGQGMILKSDSFGIPWDSLYTSETYEDFFDVHFFHLLNGVVVGGDEADSSALILRTTDGGSNWTYITPPANTYYLRAVDFVNDEGWAVGMFGTIIHTSDQGVSWTIQPSPMTQTLFDVDFSDNLHGLACGYGKILYTSDGGQTWNATSISEGENPVIVLPGIELYPNPFEKATTIKINLPHSASGYAVVIYNAVGSKIRALKPNVAPDHGIVWDRTDDSGVRVPAGVYFIRYHTETIVHEGKAIILE